MTFRNILVFRFSSLGDVALTVPVICAVLEQNADVRLSMVTPKFMHDLFPKHERLQLIDFDKENKHKGLLGLIKLLKSLNLKQYDAIADLHQVIRTYILNILSKNHVKFIAKIKKNRAARRDLIQGKSNTPLRHTAEKYADVFRELGLNVDLDFQLHNFLFSSSHKDSTIGIAPFARHVGKKYPLNKLKKVVITLSKKYEIIIFGSALELERLTDWQSIPNVSLCQENSLRKELEMISRLELMISMDSANMHLASLVGVPVISIWGVTHPHAGFLGYGQSMQWVVQDEECLWRPTSIYGNVLGPKENPTGFANVSPEMILNKVNLLLNNPHE